MNRNNTLNNLAPILLVEDNPVHTELILRGLEAGRVTNRVIHVTDGEQALAYLLWRGEYADPEISPQPGLVLLDLRLPKVDCPISGVRVERTPWVSG